MSSSILVVDDDLDFCELVAEGLRAKQFEVTAVTSGAEALNTARDNEFDAVVTDVYLGGQSGIQLCEEMAANRPDVPIVIMTGHGDMNTVIDAIRAGAYDFITKPFEIDMLGLTLQRAVQHRNLQVEVKRLRDQVHKSRQIEQMIGESHAMQRVYDLIHRVADNEATILVTGESGTGKELVARAVHDLSGRSGGPFVPINCAAMPATLLESELFGHIKGAFTDAKASRSGLFVQASGGTLFLDEIGEMPLEMQVKLLRVLQERKVRPVGGSAEVEFDTRIIAATNLDLDTEVEENRFREDLYYRINVVRIALPPLRSRGNDVLLLAQYFLDQFARRSKRAVVGIAPPTAQKLLAYDWPGNVRELENCMERAVALTRFDQIAVEDLPDKVCAHVRSQMVIDGNDPAEFPSLQEVERRYIKRVLDAVQGNKTEAARVLGLDRRTLYRRLDKLDLRSTDDS
jgi:two-component system response regulator HydG